MLTRSCGRGVHASGAHCGVAGRASLLQLLETDLAECAPVLRPSGVFRDSPKLVVQRNFTWELSQLFIAATKHQEDELGAGEISRGARLQPVLGWSPHSQAPGEAGTWRAAWLKLRGQGRGEAGTKDSFRPCPKDLPTTVLSLAVRLPVPPC